MTTYVVMGGVMFAACVGVSVGIALWQWWRPRRQLNLIFRDCRRERCAANVLRFRAPVSPPVSGLQETA